MKVEAHNLKVKNMLQKGKFIIPDYQREYDWGADQLEELICDLEMEEHKDGYFIGHMVFDGGFNNEKFYVVDGQQRITTITIMLCVLRDLFTRLNKDDLANGINDKFIFGKDESNKRFVVLESKMPYPYLQKVVQSEENKKEKAIRPISNGEKHIAYIYNSISEHWKNKSEAELINIRDTILNLEIIFVAVSDGADVTEIFQTLNATGKDLTVLDLIKNYIFRKYPKEPHIKEPTDTWNHILAMTEGKSLKFLNNFWSSRFKKVAEKRLYNEFKKEIIHKDVDIVCFLNKLKEDSQIFNKIVKPERKDWVHGEYPIFLSLEALVNVFNIEVANSFLLTLLRDYRNKSISLKELLKVLNVMERYHFIHNAVLSNRSSGLDTMYARFSSLLFNAATKHDKHAELNQIRTSLLEKIPSKAEFEAYFDDKLYFSKADSKQKKLVQYVLRKIEFKKQNTDIDFFSLSIEHIWPENAKEQEWGKIKNEKQIYNIGNLVLLDSEDNSKVGNKGYMNKKNAILKMSSILSTLDVFNTHSEWTEKNIKQRRDYLVDELYENIWK